MGTNYHTAWAASTTAFTAASMNPALAALDKGITYGTKRPIVHSDGNITWAGGTLTWASTIRILFNSAAGLAIQNTVSAGNIALSDNEFAYVTLNETNDTVLTVSKAAITTAAASTFLTLGILVLAYRNTSSDELYPVHLPIKFNAISGAGQVSTLNFIIDGGGVEITDGQKGHIVVDFACTITGWTLLADQSGAIKIDIWKDTYANFPPADGDSICNSHEPEIAASGTYAQDTDIADWSGEAITAGDILAINVDSCTTITRCTLALKVQRT